MSFENRPPRLSAAINFCARTPTLERVTILPFLLPLFADSASLHDDVAGVRAMFDSMPGTTLRSLTATSPTASLFSIAPPPAAAQLAHMHSVLERNARLAARTQAAARRAMLPLIVLLNSRAAPPARCTLPRAAGWNTLPRELQLLVMVHLSGDEGAVSRAQWRRLMSYAGDKEAVLADARAGTEVPHAHPNELGVGIGVGVGGGLKDTAGAREHVLRRLGLWHWEGPPVGDRDEDEDEDEEDRQGEGHTDANGEAEGAETEEEHETLTDDEESAAEVAEAQVAVAEAAAATDAARMDLQTAVEDAAAARATLRQTEAALNVSGAVLGAIQDVLDTVTTALERPLPPQ
jgi:hypothetical protein